MERANDRIFNFRYRLSEEPLDFDSKNSNILTAQERERPLWKLDRRWVLWLKDSVNCGTTDHGRVVRSGRLQLSDGRGHLDTTIVPEVYDLQTAVVGRLRCLGVLIGVFAGDETKEERRGKAKGKYLPGSWFPNFFLWHGGVLRLIRLAGRGGVSGAGRPSGSRSCSQL